MRGGWLYLISCFRSGGAQNAVCLWHACGQENAGLGAKAAPTVLV